MRKDYTGPKTQRPEETVPKPPYSLVTDRLHDK